MTQHVVIPMGKASLQDALNRVASEMDGNEYDEKGETVIVELYWHEGEWYAYAYRNATVFAHPLGAEGSASGGLLIPSLITEALNNLMDDIDARDGSEYELPEVDA